MVERASVTARADQAGLRGLATRIAGYELVAEAIERLEMPSDIVARALSAGLEAWLPPTPVGAR